MRQENDSDTRVRIAKQNFSLIKHFDTGSLEQILYQLCETERRIGLGLNWQADVPVNALRLSLQGIPRFIENRLGGGALVDLGHYGVSMALQVFNDEPEKIVAGAVMDNGKILQPIRNFPLYQRMAL